MAEDKNRHVKDYLTYYLRLPHSPHYAVMVKGPWGIGKTYLVKRFLKETIREPEKYVYVSLFGLASLDEIDTALLEATYPLLAGSKAAKVVGRIIKAALRFNNIDLDLNIDDFADKFNPRIFVFDDLERCEMSVNVVMGYINEFVEHEGCKVIIIANEDEIIGESQTGDEKTRDQKERAEYRRRREKIVGKTLEVQSAFNEAFAFFITQINHPETKTVFLDNAAEITSIYAQSELNNLRILQQTMWDFERVCQSLTEKHRKNARAMTALLRLIFALSFEVKAGRLGIGDLRARTDWLYAAAMEEEGGERAARRRYPEVDLADQILSDEVLIDILFRGIVDSSAICGCLDRSRYFVSVSDEPAWLTIWHLYDRTDEQFETAYKRMEKQFAERGFSDAGELLHVLGLRLFLARNEISGKTVAQIIEEGKGYIDDLYRTYQLELSDSKFRDLRFNSHAGLGFIDSDTAEFKELIAYLLSRAKQAAEDNHPRIGLQLLKEMETDPDLFLRHLCLTNSTDNLYYNVPVLASIEPDNFVKTFLNLHPSNQRIVLRALGMRYEYDGLKRELAPEKAWLEAVRAKLIANADAMSRIGKYRLMVGLKSSITSALDKAKSE